MARKTLLMVVFVGALACVFSRARKAALYDQKLERNAELRWEDEGGALAASI